jgi:hypothetical protein
MGQNGPHHAVVCHDDYLSLLLRFSETAVQH